MQPPVDELAPATGLRCFRHNGGVGRNPRYLVTLQHVGAKRRDPRFVSRLEGDVARVALSERGQKDFNVDGHELQTRRQLHKQTAQALAERRRLLDKCIEGAVDVYESLFMSDRLRQLDREAERIGHACTPSKVGGSPVRAMERRVDLRAVEHRRVPRELRTAIWKSV